MIFNEDYTVKLYQVVWHRTPKYYEDSNSIITYDNQVAAIDSVEYKWDYDKRERLLTFSSNEISITYEATRIGSKKMSDAHAYLTLNDSIRFYGN